MADLMQKRVVKMALLSRLVSIAAQSCFNNLINDYDTSEEHCSPGANITECVQSNESKHQNSLADRTVLFLLGGNSKWDAVYFLDIAENGYQYEQNMAFFPLLPLLIRSFEVILKPIQVYAGLHRKTLLTLAATLVNTTAFVFASLGLFLLTKTIFQSQKLAYRTSLFFCLNPASVFFSATYSESVFALTQFWAMFCLERGPNNYIFATLLFALGSATRSNGMVSIGFICYKILKEILHTRYYKNIKMASHRTLVCMLLLKTSQILLLACIISLPFVAFQYYGYVLFCRSSLTPPWCDHWIPLPYRYIQDHYWNVGFMKYYELKQLPNFLLAMPILIIGFLGIFDWLKNQTWNDVATLGLVSPWKGCNGPCSTNIFVYVVHLSFLLVFGVTSMHVQVITRFVASSSPMIYWFAASWTAPPNRDKTGRAETNTKANLVYIYFLVYFWLGFVLHCNFYPWT